MPIRSMKEKCNNESEQRQWCIKQLKSLKLGLKQTIIISYHTRMNSTRMRNYNNQIRSTGILPSSLSVSRSTLLSFASGGWDFCFCDYFWLVARFIVQECVSRSYTMISAHIKGPKLQQWLTSELLCSMVYWYPDLCSRKGKWFYVSMEWNVLTFSDHQHLTPNNECHFSSHGTDNITGAHCGYTNLIAYLICKFATCQARWVLSLYQPASIWITTC